MATNDSTRLIRENYSHLAKRPSVNHAYYLLTFRTLTSFVGHSYYQRQYSQSEHEVIHGWCFNNNICTSAELPGTHDHDILWDDLGSDERPVRHEDMDAGHDIRND